MLTLLECTVQRVRSRRQPTSLARFPRASTTRGGRWHPSRSAAISAIEDIMSDSLEDKSNYLDANMRTPEMEMAEVGAGVPVADLIALLSRHSGLGDDDPRRETMILAEPLGRMISPLSLPPLVPPAGRFIYAGLADQVVHPREQVNRLWEHWGRPDIEWYRGGHAGFFQARPVQRFVTGALVQSGLVSGLEGRSAGGPGTMTG